MTLYLKYRPQSIDELDLTSVRENLSAMVAKGELPHGFLFSGPRGAGKTSAARIVAKILNCEKNGEGLGEPCNECEHCKAISAGNHVDVVEMDAASNRGIDDVRALRESIMLSPSRGRKKVYIIDEVHMLTTEAANAFLKTLEEPPEHVVFILATTDPQKLPETVRSRLSNISFTKATSEEIARQLERVSKGEGFKVPQEVVVEIAKISDGSFRDAVKILEQLSLSDKKITLSALEKLVGMGDSVVGEVLECLEEKNSRRLVQKIEAFASSGGSGDHLLNGLITSLHGAMLVELGVKSEGKKLNMDFDELTGLLENLVALRASGASGDVLALEVALVKFMQKSGFGRRRSTSAGNGESKEKEKVEVRASGADGEPMDEGTWMKILSETRSQEPKIEALLRAAKPVDFDGKSLNVGVFYRFHKERLESAQVRSSFERIVEGALGGPVRVTYCLAEKDRGENEPVDQPLDSASDEDVVSAAKEIFGE